MKDSGPAFPQAPIITKNFGTFKEKGMSLRDYFAAKAMQGYLFSCVQAADNPKMCAQWAYEMADEMLKEREKEIGGT